MEKFWLLLHILSAVVVFGVGFGEPMVKRAVASGGGGSVDDAFARITTFIQAPALAVLLVTGLIRVLTSAEIVPGGDRVFEMSQAWISIAFVLIIVAAVVLFLRVRAFQSGSNSAAMLTGILHLVLLIALWDMIWKPGL